MGRRWSRTFKRPVGAELGASDQTFAVHADVDFGLFGGPALENDVDFFQVLGLSALAQDELVAGIGDGLVGGRLFRAKLKATIACAQG